MYDLFVVNLFVVVFTEVDGIFYLSNPIQIPMMFLIQVVPVGGK